MRVLRALVVALACPLIGTVISAAQTWQPLNNQPSFNPGAMLLLTDGVLMHSEPPVSLVRALITARGTSSRLTVMGATSTVHGRKSHLCSAATLHFILAL
jgi:hypothetical protein